MSNKSMADIWKELQKQHGDEGLYHGSDDMIAFADTIPSGSYMLDDALGIWGLPRGRIVQYGGQESSGKTYMSLIAIAEYQRANPNGWAMFIDAEYTFDAEWAALLGVDLDRLIVYRENSGVKIFERLVGQPSKTSAKKTKLGVLDLEKENPTGLGIIVLDSLAAMQPLIEETSEVGKQNMALMARFLPPELRKLTPLLSDTGVTFIVINQIRLTPGVMYGNPETSPGGNALKHAHTMMLNFSRIAAKNSVIEVNGERIGHHVRVRIDKNKLAPPFRVAELAITYSNGITEHNIELRELGARYGIIERPNNKTWVLDGNKYNGKDAMAEALLDKELQADILERVKNAKKNLHGKPIVNIEEETQEEVE
jgi:recombination protein RecA